MKSISALTNPAISNHCEPQESKLYKIIVASTNNVLDILSGYVVIQSSVISYATQYWSFKKNTGVKNLYYITHNYTGFKLSYDQDSSGYVQVVNKQCQYYYIEPVEEYCTFTSGCSVKTLIPEHDTPGNKLQLKKSTISCRNLFRLEEYSGKCRYL